jgi:hypothetical protein
VSTRAEYEKLKARFDAHYEKADRAHRMKDCQGAASQVVHAVEDFGRMECAFYAIPNPPAVTRHDQRVSRDRRDQLAEILQGCVRW